VFCSQPLAAYYCPPAPDIGVPFDPIPVDYLAQAIVHLGRKRESLGRAFHYFNHHPIPWREVFLLARSLGYPVRLLPPADWHRELAAAVESPAGNALTPFWPMLRGPRDQAGGAPAAAAAMEDPLRAGPRFDDRNTERGLAGSGISCPPADRALLEIYFAHFLASGFLPPPVDMLQPVM